MPELNLSRTLIGERYAIQRRLDQGRYAELYLAEDRLSQRVVVIKALNPDLKETASTELEQMLIGNFKNEAHILDLVRHPNVVQRLDAGHAMDREGIGFNYLVLEYMVGGDLLKYCRDHMPKGAMPLGGALLYTRQACEALAYAHSRGVIHRDLKPNNLLLDASYRVLKVADFGVAKLAAMADLDDEMTRVGSPIYAPPEHHPELVESTDAELTPAADVYSLAKTFYTLVSGDAPRQFKRKPIVAWPSEIATEPWAGEALDVLKRATSDRTDQRYPSVVDFWDALSNINQGRLVPDLATDEEKTLVRTRLKGQPSRVSAAPRQPDFKSFRDLRAMRRDPIVIELSSPPSKAEPLPTAQLPVTPTAPPRPQPIPTQPMPQPMPTQRPAAPPPRKKLRIGLWITLFVLLSIGVAAGSFVYERMQNAPPSELETLIDLNVREGTDAETFDSLGVIEKGTRHRVLESNSNWRKIVVSDWAAETKELLNSNQGVVQICTDCLSAQVLKAHLPVYETPSAKAVVAGAVPQNSVHVVLAQKGGWLQIRVSQWSDESSGFPHTTSPDLAWFPIGKDNARLIVTTGTIKVYAPLGGKLVRVGAVANGSSHRLLDWKGGKPIVTKPPYKFVENLIPIEISEWQSGFPRIGEVKEGWVSGRLDRDVKVTARKWWQLR